jgi:hypothetical protein
MTKHKSGHDIQINMFKIQKKKGRCLSIYIALKFKRKLINS